MFKFDFTPADLSDDDEGEPHARSDVVEADTGQNDLRATNPAVNGPPHITDTDEDMTDAVVDEFQEIGLDTLLLALPPVISYSTISIPLGGSATPVVLPRRDLFDARFQLMTSDSDEEIATEERVAVETKFLNAPSDLVPGVYEGGFKTWECSPDLITALHQTGSGVSSPRSVLELGCGTALPSCYVFRGLLSIENENARSNSTVIHFQDYNKAVLELVTLPNLLLTWFFSESSKVYRDTQSQDPATDADSSSPDAGELAITPSLSEAFAASLKARGIILRFYSGGWSTFNLSLSATCNLVLTSETIYRTSSVPSLITILRSAPSESVILVAAKVVYFGVGGGVRQFIEAVHKVGGTATPVWEMSDGVGRQVLRVSFSDRL